VIAANVAQYEHQGLLSDRQDGRGAAEFRCAGHLRDSPLPYLKSGQRPVCRGAQLTECGMVLLDELVRQRAFWSLPEIAGRIDERRRRRLPRKGGGGHGGRPCKRNPHHPRIEK
jgi:hypothetical protein